MKYEFKPFSYPSYLLDLADGWNMTFQVHEEYPNGTPREVEIVDLGEKANWQYRLASIDLSEGGTVRHHDIQGRYDSKGVPCCLDLILYREAGPKPIEIRGVAYVSEKGQVVTVSPDYYDQEAEKGQVVTVSPDYYDQEAENCKAVRCTITLHEPA